MSDDGIRRSVIEKLSRRVRVVFYPRVGMSLILIITFAGMHLSTLVLHAYGWHDMWLRYLLTCVFGYLLFLLCLYIWTHWNGYDFNGADSSGSDGGCTGDVNNVDASSALSDTSGIDIADGVASGADELLGPLIILGIVIFAIFGFIWFLFLSSAHVLLAELMFDAGLTGIIYKSMRGVEPQGWLRTALRRTLPIFAVVTFVMVGTGYYIGKHLPEATTLGEAFSLMGKSVPR